MAKKDTDTRARIVIRGTVNIESEKLKCRPGAFDGKQRVEVVINPGARIAVSPEGDDVEIVNLWITGLKDEEDGNNG